MMAYKDNGVIARLDRSATRLTGRQVHTGFTGPHMIIAANVVFLLISFAGIYATTQGQDFGEDLVFPAMFGSSFYKVLVEHKERGNRKLDEREDMIRWKSLAIGGWGVASLIGLWAVLLGSFADDGLWFPREGDDWSTLGGFIIGLTLQVTSIASAWMTPSYAAELLDED